MILLLLFRNEWRLVIELAFHLLFIENLDDIYPARMLTPQNYNLGLNWTGNWFILKEHFKCIVLKKSHHDTPRTHTHKRFSIIILWVWVSHVGTILRLCLYVKLGVTEEWYSEAFIKKKNKNLFSYKYWELNKILFSKNIWVKLYPLLLVLLMILEIS